MNNGRISSRMTEVEQKNEKAKMNVYTQMCHISIKSICMYSSLGNPKNQQTNQNKKRNTQTVGCFA